MLFRSSGGRFHRISFRSQKNNRLHSACRRSCCNNHAFYPGIPPENKRMQRSCLLHAAPSVCSVYSMRIGCIAEFLRHEQPSGFLKPFKESIFCCKSKNFCISVSFFRNKKYLLQLCDCITKTWTGTSNGHHYTAKN